MYELFSRTVRLSNCENSTEEDENIADFNLYESSESDEENDF